MPYRTNKYKAEILRWLDGDTVELRVDMGQRVYRQDKYRLYRIDAPETALRRGVTQEEKTAGLALKAQLAEQYPPGTEVRISTEKAGKYGRYLVELYVRYDKDSEWFNLNDWLIEQGLVKEYIL